MWLFYDVIGNAHYHNNKTTEHSQEYVLNYKIIPPKISPWSVVLFVSIVMSQVTWSIQKIKQNSHEIVLIYIILYQ